MRTPSAVFFSEPEHSTSIFSFVLALLVHVLLFLILFIGVQWHSQLPSGIEAEIWTELPPPIITLPSSVPPAPPSIKPVEEKVDIATTTQSPPQKKHEKTPQPTKSDSQVKPTESPAKKTVEQTDRAIQRLQKLNMERARASQLARLQNVATESGSGGTQGSASGTGAAGIARYEEKVRRKVKPNIFFEADSVSGNPTAVVKVELAPDGALLNKQLIKSSGNTAWDAEVLRALDRSSPLPRDTDGKAPPSFTILFRPRD